MPIIMKLRNIGLNTLIYTCYFFGSCVTVMLAESLLLFLLDKFVAMPYFVITLLRVVIYSVGVSALVGFLGYREGYREAVCSVGETVSAGILATLIPHLLFSMLFHFQSFVSGSVRHTVGLIRGGLDVTAEDVLPTRDAYLLFVLVFLAYGLIYTGVLTVCKYLGAGRRVVDRADLRKNERPNEQDSE